MIKKSTIIGVILLIFLTCSSAEAISLEPTPQKSAFLYAKSFLFGRTDGWFWENSSGFNWLTINGSNFRVFGIVKCTYSHEYKYGVVRQGWSWAFANFHFKGMLTQQFVCGLFYAGNNYTRSLPQIRTLGFLGYNAIEFINGEIDEFTINGEFCYFYGKNLTAFKFYRYHRSWGFDIWQAYNNEVYFKRYINEFRGTLEPTYIHGFFLTW